jgi:hypothetical protein
VHHNPFSVTPADVLWETGASAYSCRRRIRWLWRIPGRPPLLLRWRRLLQPSPQRTQWTRADVSQLRQWSAHITRKFPEPSVNPAFAKFSIQPNPAHSPNYTTLQDVKLSVPMDTLRCVEKVKEALDISGKHIKPKILVIIFLLKFIHLLLPTSSLTRGKFW